MKNRIKLGDALLVVDVQNDFFPGGALAVTHGDEIIPIVNEWITAAKEKKIPIVASRDWHPSNHCSFQEQGGPWPAHCVQNTEGSEIHPSIQLPSNTIFINKADTPENETYSAFDGTTEDGESLHHFLQQKNIRRLWVSGLALDYCVLESALHARRLGYEVHLLPEGTRTITEETGKSALQKMQNQGVIIETNSHAYE